jgi:hypothetical protein
MDLTYYEQNQVTVFLRGHATSVSINYDQMGRKHILKTGRHNALVVGVQGINNARIAISGSLDMFSNELFIKSDGANQKFAKGLLGWVSHSRGVLRKVLHSGHCYSMFKEEAPEDPKVLWTQAEANKDSLEKLDCSVYTPMSFIIQIEEWDH